MTDSTAAQTATACSVADDRVNVEVMLATWPMDAFVEPLVAGLSARGFNVSVVAPGRQPTERIRRRIECLASYTELSRSALTRDTRRGRVRVASSPILAGDLMPSIVPDRRVNSRPHVIFLPWIGSLIDYPAPLESDVPVVTSCHGSQSSMTSWSATHNVCYDALHRVLDSVDFVHCSSEAVRDDAVALGLPLAKARIIFPGVDPSLFVPRSIPDVRPNRLRAISVGPLTWQSDYERALVAVRKAVDQGLDVSADLIGGGPDRQHLMFAINDLKLQDRVCLLGQLPGAAVVERLQHADVFLRTGSSADISIEVLEAMSTGLPVITTDSGGMAEVVRPGVEGIVVGTHEVDGIVSALRSLASNPQERARMGAAGRKRVLKGFRLDAQLDAFASLLREAAGR